MSTDWRPDAEVLRDDFKPEELDDAADRHNKPCSDCAYPAE
jgi:hypothetical protein